MGPVVEAAALRRPGLELSAAPLQIIRQPTVVRVVRRVVEPVVRGRAV